MNKRIKVLVSAVLAAVMLVLCIPFTAAAAGTTVSVTIQNYMTANGWQNGTEYNTLTMDCGITITADGTDSNTGKYYNDGYEWRMYQTGNPTITVNGNGATIETVKITYNVKNTGVLTFNGNNVSSNTAVTVNAGTATFGVANTGSATNGQVKITKIEVTYSGTVSGSGNQGGTVTPPATTTCPLVVGTGYTISAVNGKGTIYVDGTISSGRFNGVYTADDAAVFYVEAATNANEYLLYFMNGTTKNYVVFTDGSSGASTTTTAANATVFEWNSDKNTLAVAEDSNNRAFGVGATSTYDNFSSYDVSGSYNWGTFTEATNTNPGGGTTPTPTPTPTPVEKSTIAQIRAMSFNTDVKTEGVVTFVSGQNVYINDGTGNMLVYTSTTVAVGDKIEVEGQYKDYYGKPEIAADTVSVVGSNNTVTPTTISLADLLADQAGAKNHLSGLVKITGVVLGTTDDRNTPVTADGKSINIRDIPKLTGIVAGNTVTVVGIVDAYDGTYQLKVAAASAITLETTQGGGTTTPPAGGEQGGGTTTPPAGGEQGGGTTTPPAGNTGSTTPSTPAKPATSIKVGVGYTISANNKDGKMYVTGGVTDKGRFEASADAKDAAVFYVEAAGKTGEYYLYFKKGEAKTYIVMDDKAAGCSVTTDKAKATVFEWNTELKTLVVAEDSNNRAFGADATTTYLNLSAYDTSNTTYNWGVFTPIGGNNGKTGDNTIAYVIVALVSLLGIAYVSKKH